MPGGQNIGFRIIDHGQEAAVAVSGGGVNAEGLARYFGGTLAITVTCQAMNAGITRRESQSEAARFPGRRACSC